ncbi:MAG: lipase family protein [Magnetococcales bacterium]|nr:lipase family protein [Magnetococcales bacterium]
MNFPFDQFEYGANSYRSVNALALVHAAKLAYENKAKVTSKAQSWGFTNVYFVDNADTSTQAFVACNDKYAVVAFRGTQEITDVWTDLNITTVPGLGGEVHKGFWDSLDSIWKELDDTMQKCCSKERPIWFTGHSLGGALATLAADRFFPRVRNKPRGIYTYGSPRCGDEDFANAYNKKFLDSTFRFVNNNDLVTRVPPRSMGYRDVGTLRYFDAIGQLHGNLSIWESFLDKLNGRIESALSLRGLDEAEDHHMKYYMKLIQDHVYNNTKVIQ